jgi:hypothetical protein
MDCLKKNEIPLPDGSDEITKQEWREWTSGYLASKILFL